MIIDVNKNKRFIIGEFNPDEILNEVSITSDTNQLNVDKIGLITVSVYGSEGPIPHVHLIGNKFDCCICLHKAIYFSHGNNHQSIFTKQSQRDLFDMWMSKQNKNNSNKTNFETAKETWENNNPRIIIPIGNKPDYRKLSDQYNEN